MTLSRRELLVVGATAAIAAVHTSCKSLSGDTRTIKQLVTGAAHKDGAGVKLRKLLGGRALPLLDPFLMLDEFRSDDPRDFIAGFPNHPHRGFETVTIMVDGFIEHKDSVGNQGTISGGGIQWMTAGRGIVHAEMPRSADTPGAWLWGYQLWVNLPARDKLIAPRYQELTASDFPTTNGVRVLAGSFGATRGPIDGIAVKPTALDVTLPANETFRHELPRDHNAFLQILDGTILVGERTLGERGLVALHNDGGSVEARAVTASRFMLIAGAPIGEPVARRGPFVMNTEAELDQAVADYRSGRLTG